ncbi:unnamed protein product [Ambrosiozyma monospora]|uniref:Unnamed protein product n=1 Tax=Ambrosiozyma monospora TaxID=43982 RepID=A0ACB5T0W8_AMBMO|nr:unnamed protein product [Ambrosiozyma monospora]
MSSFSQLALLTINENVMGGRWMSLMKKAIGIRLCGFGNSNRMFCSDPKVAGKVVSIHNVRFPDIPFLIKHLERLTNIKYVSLQMNDKSPGYGYVVNRISNEQISAIAKCVPKVTLFYEGDADTLVINRFFRDLESISSRVRVQLHEVFLNDSSQTTDVAIELLKRKQIHNLSFDKFSGADLVFIRLPLFTQLCTLTVRTNKPLKYAVLANERLRRLKISAPSLQMCDFSRLENLMFVTITGLMDCETFNTFPSTVQSIFLHVEPTKGKKPTLIEEYKTGNGLRKTSLAKDALNGVFHIYKLPENLTSFRSTSSPMCYEIDFSNCKQLAHLDIDHTSLGTIYDYKFWNQLPKTVKRIDLRVGGSHHWMYFVASLHKLTSEVVLNIHSETPFVVFTTSVTVDDMITGRVSSHRIPVRTIGEQIKKSYCVIHGYSPRVVISCSRNVSLIYPEFETEKLDAKCENGNVDYKPMKTVMGCVVYDSCD